MYQVLEHIVLNVIKDNISDLAVIINKILVWQVIINLSNVFQILV